MAVTGFDDATALLDIVRLHNCCPAARRVCHKAVELLWIGVSQADHQVYTISPFSHKILRLQGVGRRYGQLFALLKPLRSHGRFHSLDETTFYSALTDCLIEYGMNSCYIVRFLTPIRFDDYAALRQSLKGTLIYGFSEGRKVQYAQSIDASNILPDVIFESLEGIALVRPIFIGNDQLGYIVMSAPEKMTGFMADLCADVQQYIENAFLAHEKQQVEKKLSDTLERLINTNRKLNELTVRNNLDKMKKIRSWPIVSSKQELSSSEYYLILVEIDNL